MLERHYTWNQKVGRILANPGIEKGKTITTETVHLVTNVYEDDNFSSMKRKTMLVHKQGVKMCVNKNFAACRDLCNLQELYTAFKGEHSNVNIVFSKFCAWDPNGVFWLAQKWLTLFAFVTLIKMLCCYSTQGTGAGHTKTLQLWEQQMHHGLVWNLSWHCNSERISWWGIQQTWGW